MTVRRLAARWYLPAFLVPAAALALLALGWRRHFDGVRLGGPVADSRLIVIGPATIVALAAILVVERLRPAQRRPLVARGHRHDLLYTVFNAVVVVPFLAVLGLVFSQVVRSAMPWLVLPANGAVPKWLVTVAILVAMDACNYAAHLANHRVRFLWRFHELHHSQEDMNVLTVFRTHPLIHVSYLVASLPAIVLLANGGLSTAVLVAYGVYVAFEHSNTNLGFGPLERLFVSPNYHRVHHRLEGRQDVNMGFVLTVWDQLFGTAVFPTEASIRADTGLPGRVVRVEQEGDRPHHLRVFAVQLVAPFRPIDKAPADHASGFSGSDDERMVTR